MWMVMMKRTGTVFSGWLIGGITLILLTACAPALPSPTPTPVPSETPLPTATATVTQTPSLTPTVTSTSTPTLTLTPSLTPTPETAFDQARPIELTSGVGGWRLTFAIPHLNRAVNVIAAGIRFNCAFDAQYPDRLFCYGLSKPPLDQKITLAFLDADTGKVLYQSETVFASAALPTPVPKGYSNTNCAERGQKVTCETECRVDPSTGIPCIVSSCFDACGPYYSVDSCPAGVSVWNICSAEQWEEMKAKFNIP
ncbi:MAG TPA: hypothetical protein DEQ80_10805 [Anaerolinea thermolimosa]|uniref:Uncharacterized protein n=1 Tax=Anaerolinea thermolimosa TaxID=229919 RepID=A0A3D1JKQ6_9CHLR|nr:hypothetical protein [Anaerolinea thermolimosa]